MGAKFIVVSGVGVAAYLAFHGVPAAVASLTSATPPVAATGAAAKAIAYATAQEGRPYLWGGTGPGAFDCSGLVMVAYAKAGVSIPRTSQAQYAAGTKVSTPAPGDLVYFAGSDGTTSAPGHVGLVIGPNKMIEAYATGFAIRVSSFGTPQSPAGDQNPVGFTDPTAHAAVS
jgi:cell wall-associated NlpC family hydrolase